MAPVPAPTGLVAELFVSNPGAAWKKLRDTSGAVILPQSYGVLLTTLLGLPPLAADAFDDSATTTGAVALDEASQWQATLAIKLVSGREFIARLTTGSKAAYEEKKQDGGITLLAPKPGKASEEITLAVLGNTLLVARSAAAVTRLGPYAAKSLPRKKPPAPGAVLYVPKTALSGPVAAEVRKRWKALSEELSTSDLANRQKHGGRAPDFGDPQAALAVMTGNIDVWVKMLQGADHAQLELRPEADALRVHFEVDPGQSADLGKWVKELAVGSASPLLVLPDNAAVGVVTRSSSEQRAHSAQSTADAIGRLFGDRLKATDKERVAKALTELAQARGDEAVFGFVRTADSGGLVYRGPTTDQRQLDSAAKSLVGLLRLPAFEEPLRQFVGEFNIKQSSAKIAGLPNKAERVLLSIKPSGMRMAKDPKGQVSAAPRPVELMWTSIDDVTYGAMTIDAPPLLVAMVAAESSKTWAGLPAIATGLSRVGKDAGFVAAVRPQLLLANAPTASPGLATIALGRSGKLAVLDVTADQAAMRFFMQRAMTQ
jgi:hypothetical protein